MGKKKTRFSWILDELHLSSREITNNSQRSDSLKRNSYINNLQTQRVHLAACGLTYKHMQCNTSQYNYPETNTTSVKHVIFKLG